jgi:hypothetical protein
MMQICAEGLSGLVGAGAQVLASLANAWTFYTYVGAAGFIYWTFTNGSEFLENVTHPDRWVPQPNPAPPQAGQGNGGDAEGQPQPPPIQQPMVPAPNPPPVQPVPMPQPAPGGAGGMQGGRGGFRPRPPTQIAPPPTIPENRLGHIFRPAEGHLTDTPANRQLLIDTASNPANCLGTDRFGNTWYAVTRPDGTQVWVQVRDGQIINGGVNQPPRAFNPETGLSGRGGNP